ncbi:type VII secretion-associated serine protease mycosin [Micromonospora endolithica]|uniref:Type VII secretion-associated serine protease mycosin n=1 Tax=Micromonospora endolithica TaxID=230091 RepID=A0A3A9Z3G3_9ACTN|nr:type VII secretion-associated serine protease mycosin [Micromonospora endolithica]
MITIYRYGAWARCGAVALTLLAVVGGTAGAMTPAEAKPGLRAQQWWLEKLRVPEAHKISKGRGVIVGVIDSGVEANHPDLRGRVLTGASYMDGPVGKDLDTVKSGHGTAMAALIAGSGPGRSGYLGMAPEAEIWSGAVLGGGVLANSDTIFGAVREAVDHGASVINLSLGGSGGLGYSESNAVEYALEHDVVVVISAGNVVDGNGTATQGLATIPGAIIVSGLDRSLNFFEKGSRQGEHVVVAAPEQDILTATNTSEQRGLRRDGGTSSAAAITSGLVALVRSKYPDLDAPNVINRVIRTAKDRGATGRDPQYGFGAIDPVAALTADVPPVTANPLGKPSEVHDTAPSKPRWDRLFIAIAVAFGVTVIVVAVTVVVIRSSRRRRSVPGRPPAAGPPVAAGPPMPGPYQPVPAHHPGTGYQPPPGYQPTAAGPGRSSYPQAPQQTGWQAPPPPPPAPGSQPGQVRRWAAKRSRRRVGGTDPPTRRRLPGVLTVVRLRTGRRPLAATRSAVADIGPLGVDIRPELVDIRPATAQECRPAAAPCPAKVRERASPATRQPADRRRLPPASRAAGRREPTPRRASWSPPMPSGSGGG